MRGKWWQAYRELLGRPGRNIIISICIFILTLFCGGATFCDSAIECFCENFANIANNCVLVEIDDYSTLDDWNSLLGYIKMNESVKGYNNAFTSDIICQALDFKNYPYNESEQDFDSDKVFISGNIDTKYNEFFNNGIFKIVSGNYPGIRSKGIMLPENLAVENNLSIGSSISVQYEENEISVEVIGIYKVMSIPKLEIREGFYKEYTNSILFVDYDSYNMLNHDEKCYGINFFSKDYISTSQLYEDMKKKFYGIENTAVVNQVLNQELQMTDVISILKNTANVSLGIMYIICVIAMSLLTILWLRGHSSMIAIYNILGQRKIQTIQILLYEILMVSFPSILIAGFIIICVTENFSMIIFKYIVDFCEIANVQKQFSIDIWNFQMDVPHLMARIGILEIVIVLIVMFGSLIYINKSMRQLRVI